MQIIEPAPYLTRVFYHEITRIMRFKPLLVLEGVMLLCKGYRCTLKPAVQDLGNPVHFAAALALEVNLIHILTVEVIKANAALFLYLVKAAENHTLFALIAFPNGYRCAPVSVSRYVPVPRVFKPLSESAVLYRFGNPVYILVKLNEPILYSLNIEVPRLHSLVYQGLTASPAVGIIVLNAARRNELTFLAELSYNILIALHDVAALVPLYI